MNRRDILKTTLAVGAVSTLGADSTDHQAETKTLLRPPSIDPGRLVNEPWAREVLERAGIDGIVALNPVNIFYLTNYTSFYDRMKVPFASFGVFPCDDKRSSFLVTSSADSWAISNGERVYPPVMAYSQPSDWEPYLDRQLWNKEPASTDRFGSVWPTNTDSLSGREQHWLEHDAKLGESLAPSSVYALVRALREAGLEKGRLAVDDMRVANLLHAVGFDGVTCIEGDNVLRKIRVVKSKVEISHMRMIAQANQAASMAAVSHLSLGATANDINHLFAVEAAKRGAKSMWLVTGGVGGLPNAELLEGKPILFDAVSQINNYHGDFGRTVVLGEPTRKLQQRARLIDAGWRAAFESLRPGVRYSEIRKVARAAMKKTGLPEAKVGITPHSVGLQHTDEPYRDGLPFIVKDDLVLRENMTLTVDFPSMELGWGSCHLEDLVRITRDGAEPLATMDGTLVVV